MQAAARAVTLCRHAARRRPLSSPTFRRPGASRVGESRREPTDAITTVSRDESAFDDGARRVRVPPLLVVVDPLSRRRCRPFSSSREPAPRRTRRTRRRRQRAPNPPRPTGGRGGRGASKDHTPRRGGSRARSRRGTLRRLRATRPRPPGTRGRPSPPDASTARLRGSRLACAAVPQCPAARSRAHNRRRRRERRPGSSTAGTGPKRDGPDPAFDDARDTTPSPSRTRSLLRTRHVRRFRQQKTRRLRRGGARFRSNGAASPVERAEPERGRLARRGAVASRRRERRERRRRAAAGDGGPRVPVPVRARRRRGRVRLRDDPGSSRRDAPSRSRQVRRVSRVSRLKRLERARPTPGSAERARRRRRRFFRRRDLKRLRQRLGRTRRLQRSRRRVSRTPRPTARRARNGTRPCGVGRVMVSGSRRREGRRSRVGPGEKNKRRSSKSGALFDPRVPRA